MDILDPENYREEYTAFMQSLLIKEWTIKINHSKFGHVKTKRPFAFATINITPVIVLTEKRYCVIEFTVHGQKFRTNIYTPISITVEEFLINTYNKLSTMLTEELKPEIWDMCNVDVKLGFKQIKSSSI
jgi:hypothetical protein